MAPAAQTERGYILESEEEAKRLSNQHEVIKDAMDGRLLRVPVDLEGEEGLRVLDSGTADGTWIRDLISTLPSTTASKHTFIGTDINPKDFPSSPPPNTAYVIQDILSPYPPTWHSSFSFIHQRLVLPGAGTNQKLALQSLTELVKPSGWIQLIEAENIPHPDDGPHMHDFITFKRAVFTGMGANLKLTSDIPEWLGEVSGFHKEEVQSELVWMKLGAANRSEELGKRGVYSTGKLVEALVPFAKGLGTFDEKKVFGESGSTLDGFAEDLRGELRSRGGHLPLRVLWAQRST